MSGGTVFGAGWSLDDIPWERFDRSRVEPGLLEAVKAASLVEYNAPDYVTYLRRVFQNAPAETLASIDQWGREEIQHGLALGRWGEIADPEFDFETAFARFRAGFKAPHFANDETVSIRGSRRGEMIARCVVESGTSSFYSAIRDATDEPVLKEIAGRIAADEFRHYKLFFETLQAQDEPDLPFWRKLLVAVTRVNESDDDELAYAFYSANIPIAREAEVPYRREVYAKAYHARAMGLYRRHHIRKLVQMVAKAVGADPQGRSTGMAEAVLWRVLRIRAGLAGASAPAMA
jgi:rubrerythrin